MTRRRGTAPGERHRYKMDRIGALCRYGIGAPALAFYGQLPRPSQVASGFRTQSQSGRARASFHVLFVHGNGKSPRAISAGKQAYFATLSKYIPALHASLYASLNYSQWDDGFNLPVGFDVALGKGFSVRPMYDGDRSHLLLNYFAEQFGVSLMYVWLETPGIALFYGF
jgi:hypothetical protein